ncbi:MAG: hypothetical protein LBC72_03995 [Spirochaetaceae bacterium]|jgi:hypothetical protein|nr:hypothetical protein [Spirochaetaceae bacterium]
MRKRFSVFCLFFVYDAARLAFITELFARFLSGGGAGALPAVALTAPLAAPHALFPLMAFFFWRDTERCRAFIPLYTAGKCICAICLAAAALFQLVTSPQPAMATLLQGLALEKEGFLLLTALAALSFVDTLTAIALAIKSRRL